MPKPKPKKKKKPGHRGAPASRVSGNSTVRRVVTKKKPRTRNGPARGVSRPPRRAGKNKKPTRGATVVRTVVRGGRKVRKPKGKGRKS